MRASTRAAITTTALNPQPILLKTNTSLPSQTPEFLPVQPTSIETQEPEAQDATTSFSLHQVVVTQEPATHSVVETQEPAIAITQEPTTTETQELAIAITQEPATAETEEPTANFIPEVQESHAKGVETLFSFHQVAETQESVVDFVSAQQEPDTEAMTVTQKPVNPLDTPMIDQQTKPTMASVLQENEFLRSKLEAYKQELVMAKEAYDRELNLHTLARVASMEEKNTKDDQYREYMCSQCGDIYDKAGYNVFKDLELQQAVLYTATA
jgi:hypothetical protein